MSCKPIPCVSSRMAASERCIGGERHFTLFRREGSLSRSRLNATWTTFATLFKTARLHLPVRERIAIQAP
jgi:hypothetical protein